MKLQPVLTNHSRLSSLSLSALLRHAKICWESDGVSRARGMLGRVMTSQRVLEGYWGQGLGWPFLGHMTFLRSRGRSLNFNFKRCNLKEQPNQQLFNVTLLENGPPMNSKIRKESH